MKSLLLLIAALATVPAAASQEAPAAPVPTLAVSETTKSVVVTSEAADDESITSVRRRGLFGRRGYVVLKHDFSCDGCTATREVVDRCGCTVRSVVTKTVTRCCNCCNCTPCNCK